MFIQGNDTQTPDNPNVWASIDQTVVVTANNGKSCDPDYGTKIQDLMLEAYKQLHPSVESPLTRYFPPPTAKDPNNPGICLTNFTVYQPTSTYTVVLSFKVRVAGSLDGWERMGGGACSDGWERMGVAWVTKGA